MENARPNKSAKPPATVTKQKQLRSCLDYVVDIGMHQPFKKRKQPPPVHPKQARDPGWAQTLVEMSPATPLFSRQRIIRRKESRQTTPFMW